MRTLIAAALVAAFSLPALAQQSQRVNPPPYTGAGATSPTVTVTNTAGKLVSGNNSGRVFLDVMNNGATGNITICFGAACVPAANAGGSITIPPGGVEWFDGNFVPSDQVNAICSVATCNVTVIVWPPKF